MPDNDNPPLHLCEILEQEFVQLHGPLPNGYPHEADPETRLEAIYRAIHALPEKRTAICFSGGGIRSATFGLGVMQGLARHGLLGKFDFVSTVSGGGYVGSWLSAWIHRQGMRNVQRALKSPPKWKLQPEPEAVRHLRAYSNYMTPKLGLLSADTWTLVAIFFRNMILNWCVLVPFILAVLVLPRLLVSLMGWRGASSGLVQAMFWGAVLCGIFSIAYIVANRPSLSNPLKPVSRWPPDKRSEGWFLLFGLLPLVGLALMIVTYWMWLRPTGRLHFRIFGYEVRYWVAFTLFGVMLHSVGFLASKIWVRQLRPLEPFVIISSGAVGGFLTWLVAVYLFPHAFITQSVVHVALYACFAAPLFLLLFLLATTMFVGLGSYHTDDADREWLARAGAWILIAIVGWSFVSALVIFAPVALLYLGMKTKIFLTALGTASGVFTLTAGQSAATPASQQTGDQQKKSSGLKPLLMNAGLALAAPIFALFILIVLVLGTSWFIKKIASMLHLVNWASFPDSWKYDPYRLLNIVSYTPVWLVVVIALLILGFGILMGLFVNINKFSLHSAYRDRLIRAYLGASRSKTERRPNPFTGLDEDDNIQMHELQTELIYAGSFLNLDRLIARLRSRTDAVSQFVWGGLSDETRRLLDVYGSPSVLPRTALERETVEQALADDLNRLLNGKSIYDPQVFKDVPLTPEIEALLRQDPLVEVVRLNRLLLEEAYAGDIAPSRKGRPLHVVNITLNLVAGKDLAWQDRKAVSFTVSPLHSGSYCVGYRSSKDYGLNKKKAAAISLGTAAAISGAAASPNMGYYSSPPLTFLMTLFNVRLGWWLGNPGRAGEKTYRKPGPFFAPSALLSETLGRTDAEHPYVYLSDGGHFENLGLYEMVLRRCHTIFVSDGSADPTFTFNDLGGAIAKIREDFGIPIVFDEIPIQAKPADLPTYTKENIAGHKYCAIGRICYSCIDSGAQDGVLIYIKPTVYGTESADVYHYAKSSPTFPHESTGDQMYSETQFESYRALGSHIVNEICAGKTSLANLDELANQVRVYLGTESAPAPLPDCPP